MKKILYQKVFAILSVMIAVFWYAPICCQSASIKGTLTSKYKPLAFAFVNIDGTKLNTFSDEKGEYKLDNIQPGSYVLNVSLLGYTPIIDSFDINLGEHLILHYNLQEEQTILDDIVVTGTMKEVSRVNSPVHIEVYKDIFFKSNPEPSLFESLQNVNGVRPQVNCNVCNTGDIHINGLEGPYTMVLIDGMPIVSGLSTVYGMTGIPQSLIDRIEVIKGPASTLYGSEAVGGLINVITKNTTTAPKFSMDIFGSSWGEINTDLGASFSINKKLKSIVGLNYFNYQNPIDNNNDGFTDLTLQDRISLFNKVDIKRKSNRIFTLATRYLSEDRWGGDMRWDQSYKGSNIIYGESIITRRWEAFGVYQLPFDEVILLRVSANGHQQNSFYGDTQFDAEQYIYFGQLTYNRDFGVHDFLAGLSYRWTKYNDNTPVTFVDDGDGINGSDAHLPGLFLQDEVHMDQSNTLLLGIRYDRNNIHGSIWSPRLNHKWQSKDKSSTLRMSIGNGYRVVNVFTEDHAALTGARSIQFSHKLSPETSWNTNLNYSKSYFNLNHMVLNMDASVFYTFFHNRILPDYDSDPNKVIYGNLNGNFISRGTAFNIDFSTDFGLKVIMGATLMNAYQVEDGVKKRPILTERFRGVWTVSYNLPSLDLELDYTGNILSPMRLPLLGPLDERAPYSPWWSIQNIQVTKTINDQWQLYGGIKNIFNYTPPKNSIARPFDPFDNSVLFDSNGQPIATTDNPQALTFDPSYVFAPNQGIRAFLGIRYRLE